MKEVTCPLCKTKLEMFQDGSGVLCPKKHFVTNIGYND